MNLGKLAKSLQKLKNRGENDPMRFWHPTRPQRQFLADTNATKALIAGNQIGKTAIGAFSAICHCLARHPFIEKLDPAPINALLICHSHLQKRIIEEKLWAMLPKNEIVDTQYRHGFGFVGQQSVVKFRNGSLLRILSAGSGAGGGLGGSTINYCWADEPIEQTVYNELLSRVARGGKNVGPNGRRGWFTMTLTPVGGVDVSYLQDLIEAKKISVTYGRLSVDDTTPLHIKTGEKMTPLMSDEQVKSITDQYLSIDREARISGSLVGVVAEGIIFDRFEERMISDQPVPTGGEYVFAIGIDHGTERGAQVAILSCIDVQDIYNPRLYILDEYVSSGAPPEYHARGILDMIKNNGLKPEQIQHWTGDGDHSGGRGKENFKISNIILMRAFERILKYPPSRLPWRIRRAYKYKHSVFYGISQLVSIMSRRHFQVSTKCPKLIEAIKNYTIKKSKSAQSRCIHTHKIDALRYNCVNVIANYKSSTPNARIRIR
jgi:hypothetical protein